MMFFTIQRLLKGDGALQAPLVQKHKQQHLQLTTHSLGCPADLIYFG